jgi:hypothetical protein
MLRNLDLEFSKQQLEAELTVSSVSGCSECTLGGKKAMMKSSLWNSWCQPAIGEMEEKNLLVYTHMGTSTMTKSQEILPTYFSRHHLLRNIKVNHTPQVDYNSGPVTQVTIQGSLLYIVQMYTDPHGIKKLRPDYITPLVNSNTPKQKSQDNSYTIVQVSMPSGMLLQALCWCTLLWFGLYS